MSSPAMAATPVRRCRGIRQVDYVTFTGSPPTGTAIQQAAAVNNRGVTMELGGKSPQIVFADADIAKAAPALVNAIIQNGGQTCSAGSRVLVERPVYEAVAAELSARFAALVAAPHDADLDLGALINARQKARVAAMVAEAEAAGATILARGSIAEDAPAGGHYFAPVLFGDVDPQAALAQEEVFGPVLALFPFDTEDEAIALANSTDVRAGRRRLDKRWRAPAPRRQAGSRRPGIRQRLWRRRRRRAAVRRLRQVGPRPREGF